MQISRIDKRVVLVTTITLAIALSFWMGSRIPNLNEKAMMGGDTSLEALGFDQVLLVQPDDPFMTRALYTTVNWLDTNKRGMTFGVSLAACLMTLLSLFRRKSFRSGFANAMMGALIGTPLGVCVNCAAPIAKGLHSGGTRLETTLATMISSPTMNMIVLTMLLALFPWYMILAKMSFSLLFILVGIPILCRMLYTQEQLETLGANVPGQDPDSCELPSNPAFAQACDLDLGNNSWLESIRWLGPALLRNFWFIVKTTVPLMFLAGFLGSIMVIALPWDQVIYHLPPGGGPLYSLMMMTGLALFGVFLPVPIAFDVILVAILTAGGLPVKYGMVLLFTLGIFSVYSFHIVWRYISRPVAVTVFLAVAAFGVVAGSGVHFVSHWDDYRQRTAMFTAFSQSEALISPDYSKPPGLADTAVIAELASERIESIPVSGLADRGIHISRIPFRARSGEPSGPRFTTLSSEDMGISDDAPFRVIRQVPPTYWGRGVATGDVHQDGWPDLLAASDSVTYQGISLYANRQGESFVEQRIDIPALKGLTVLNVALVDINNDGWLDIFIGSYRDGNYIIYNEKGRFLEENLSLLPSQDSIVAVAVAFGDVDEDGDLDIVLGNWSLGEFRHVVPGEPESSRNLLLIQEDGEFEPRVLRDYPAETLSTLFTDLNHDGLLDLIVGNEYERTDIYYYGDGNGGFDEILADDGIIPHTTTATMNVVSGDINNDLDPEVFLGQITTGVGAGFAESLRHPDAECDDVQDDLARSQCVENLTLNTDVSLSRQKRDAVGCLSIRDPLNRQDCLALHTLWSAMLHDDRSFCAMIPALYDDTLAICNEMFASKHVVPPESEVAAGIRQILNFNVLLTPDGTGSYVDAAEDSGIEITGWTWNGKFADIDHDEWQDLYVVNGRYRNLNRESNYFFKNQQGLRFEELTADYDLTDFRATGGYSYVDFDADGDLDVISIPANAPIQFLVNNASEGNSIIFSLRDHIGNRFGIESTVIIRYGADGSRQQMREIKASGGFISFDDPVAHFGLGSHDQVEEIEIRWSSGSPSVLRGPFEANSRYIIERKTKTEVVAHDSHRTGQLAQVE